MPDIGVKVGGVGSVGGTPNDEAPPTPPHMQAPPRSHARPTGGSNQHPLERVWCFWLSSWETQNGKPVGVMQDLGCVGTIEEFWAYFNNISVLTVGSGTSVHIFQKGIKPTWEDPRNLKGGHISMAARSAEESSKMWLELSLALIGEHFDHGDHINGIGIDVKSKGNAIKVWLNDSYDADLINGTKAQCRQMVNPNSVVSMKFVPHRILLGTMHSKEKEQRAAGGRKGHHRRMQSAPEHLVGFDPNQQWEHGGGKRGGGRNDRRGGRAGGRADLEFQIPPPPYNQPQKENEGSTSQPQQAPPQPVQSPPALSPQTAPANSFTHNPYGGWASPDGQLSDADSDGKSHVEKPPPPPARPQPQQPRRRPHHQRTFSEADAFRFVPSEPLYHHQYINHGAQQQQQQQIQQVQQVSHQPHQQIQQHPQIQQLQTHQPQQQYQQQPQYQQHHQPPPPAYGQMSQMQGPPPHQQHQHQHQHPQHHAGLVPPPIPLHPQHGQHVGQHGGMPLHHGQHMQHQQHQPQQPQQHGYHQQNGRPY